MSLLHGRVEVFPSTHLLGYHSAGGKSILHQALCLLLSEVSDFLTSNHGIISPLTCIKM